MVFVGFAIFRLSISGSGFIERHAREENPVKVEIFTRIGIRFMERKLDVADRSSATNPVNSRF